MIGLSHYVIDRKWDTVSDSKRMSLTPTWRRQFEQFASMEDGDCVLVVNGHTDILGVGLTKGPYEYRKELDKDFFDHVRRVRWLVAYEWDHRKTASIDGFDNTLLRIDEGSQFWRLARIRLDMRGEIPTPLREKGARREVELERKYGPDGEGKDHKWLKHWVIDHPESVVDEPILDHHEEYRFRSGDRADIIFDLPNKRYCVVEIETDTPDPGVDQAIKYRTLKCAELGQDIKSTRIEGVLVAAAAPEDLGFCRKYGIRFVRKNLA